MVDISIIVPVYNVEKYLSKFFHSITSQTYKNYEVIIINDGSTDNSGEICDEFSKSDIRVKVIHQKNQGTGTARNRGLDIAKGKYIYFCDPDDYLEPNLLEENYNLAEKYKTNLLIFGYYDEFITKNGNKIKPKSFKSSFMETSTDFRNIFGELYKTNMMYTLWNKIYKKEFLVANNCRFGNERVGQDTVFNYKVYENLDRVYINEKLYYHYVKGRIGSAVNKYREDRFIIRYKETEKLELLIEKWGYSEKYQSLILNDLLRTLTIGIDNLLAKDCPLSKIEIKKKIINYINSPKISYMFNNISLENYNSLTKIKIKMLKRKKIFRYIFILKIKNMLKLQY